MSIVFVLYEMSIVFTLVIWFSLIEFNLKYKEPVMITRSSKYISWRVHENSHKHRPNESEQREKTQTTQIHYN